MLFQYSCFKSTGEWIYFSHYEHLLLHLTVAKLSKKKWIANCFQIYYLAELYLVCAALFSFFFWRQRVKHSFEVLCSVVCVFKNRHLCHNFISKRRRLCHHFVFNRKTYLLPCCHFCYHIVFKRKRLFAITLSLRGNCCHIVFKGRFVFTVVLRVVFAIPLSVDVCLLSCCLKRCLYYHVVKGSFLLSHCFSSIDAIYKINFWYVVKLFLTVIWTSDLALYYLKWLRAVYHMIADLQNDLLREVDIIQSFSTAYTEKSE